MEYVKSKQITLRGNANNLEALFGQQKNVSKFLINRLVALVLSLKAGKKKLLERWLLVVKKI